MKHLAGNICAAALATIAKKYKARLGVFEAKRFEFAAMDADRLARATASNDLHNVGADERTPRARLDRFQRYSLPDMVGNLRAADGWTLLYDPELLRRRAC